MRVLCLAAAFLLLLGSGCGSQTSPTDADVIEQLRQAGSDLQKAHPIEFFFYFPAQVGAESACRMLESQGYSVVVQPGASTTEFLCQAKRPLVPKVETLSRLRSDFDSLAAEFGGEYDGWGAPVVE